MRTRAFTYIELTVSIAVIISLATLTILNVAGSRITARDAARRTGAETIYRSLISYGVANGHYLVTEKAANGSLVATPQDCANDVQVVGEELTLAGSTVRPGCVGSMGVAYGMVNVGQGEVVTVSTSPSTITRRYGAVSLAQGLVSQGFLAGVIRDPLTTSEVVASNQRDFVVVRCCADGIQSIGIPGSLFSVLYKAEREVVDATRTNVDSYCGGLASVRAPETTKDYSTPVGSEAAFNPYTETLGGIGNGAISTAAVACKSSNV